jgi:hypothetical protein
VIVIGHGVLPILASDSTPVIEIKEACEQFEFHLRASISKLQVAIREGPSPTVRYASVINCTGNQTADYWLELYCIVIYFKQICEQNYSDFNVWAARLFTEVLNALGAQRVGVPVSDSSTKHIRMTACKECGPAVDTLMTSFQHVPCTGKLRKNWVEIQVLLHQYVLHKPFEDDGNLLTQFLQGVNNMFHGE